MRVANPFVKWLPNRGLTIRLDLGDFYSRYCIMGEAGEIVSEGQLPTSQAGLDSEGDRLGFAILVRDGAEVMLQSIESVRKDAPQFVPKPGVGSVGSFIEVEDFADVLKRLEGYPIALPERTTFYGMREIGVFEPGGHTVVFAMRTSA